MTDNTTTDDETESDDGESVSTDSTDPGDHATHVEVEDLTVEDPETQEAEYSRIGQTFATMRAISAGHELPDLDEDTSIAIGQALSERAPGFAANAALGMRSPGANGGSLSANAAPVGQLSGSFDAFDVQRSRRSQWGPGRSHDGTRDYWDVFGYPEPGAVSPESMTQFAERVDPANTMAYRIVNDAWKNDPTVVDDAHASDDGEAEEEDAEGNDHTEFERQVQQLFNNTRQGKGLLHYWKLADQKQRPEKYSLLLLGLDDGGALNEPVNVENLDGPGDLRYCEVYAQSDVVEWKVAAEYNAGHEMRRDPQGEANGRDAEDAQVIRPDTPVLYKVRTEVGSSDGGSKTISQKIHHSRIIHIVENPVSEYLGRECFLPALNRLIDYQKVMGATAEGYFAHADRKYIGSAKTDGVGQGADPEDIKRFDMQMYEMLNEGRTTAYTENMELQAIDGDAVDPSGAVDQLWPGFSTVAGIPQRIMKGTERGDLASTQDDANYFGNVGEHQGTVCAGAIMRPTLDRLIDYGVTVTPDGDVDLDDTVLSHAYSLHFDELFELTEAEQAGIQKDRAETINKAENAIAMGADREATYQWLDMPMPDTGQQATRGGSSPSDAEEESKQESDGPDETNAEVRGQFADSQSLSNAVATDGGADPPLSGGSGES